MALALAVHPLLRTFQGFVTKLLRRQRWSWCIGTTLAARLESAAATSVAWAAAEIAQRQLPGFDPQLLRALKAWRSADGPEAEVVRLLLLDALVRTNAVVPAAALRAHLHGASEVAAFVLLARAAQLNELDLLASFRERDADAPRDLRWVAEGNLLAALRTPGFASTLLRTVHWQLRVDVVTPGDPDPGPGACHRFPARRPRSKHLAGFPTAPTYSFVAGRDGEVLAPGAVPVAYVRTVAEGEVASQPLDRVADDHVVAWHWLQVLAGRQLAPPHRRIVVSHDADSVLVAAVEHERAAIGADRRELLRALVAACALSPVEVMAVDKSLAVAVVDRRSVKNGALPSCAEGF